MKYFFPALFILSGGVHLYACRRNDSRLRARTKWILLPALLGWYCASASPVRWIVVAALLMSWLGDVFLIGKGVKWFTAGGIAFVLSHLCFVLAYSARVDFARVGVVPTVLAALFYAAVSVLLFRALKPHLPRALSYPMFFYLLVNGCMNCFALFQLISFPCAAAAVIFVGATQFYLSDVLLFFVRFNRNSRQKNHFFVMLTYLIAELLIVCGLLLLG